MWTELQVWIGYPMRERSEVGVFAVAPCFDGSRRCTRVITVGERERAGLSWTQFEKRPDGKYPEDIPFAPPILDNEQFLKAVRLGTEEPLVGMEVR